MLERAWLLYQQNRHHDALEQVQQSLSQAPENPEAYYLMAMAHLQLKQPQPALDAASQCVQLAPDDPRGHYALAWIYYNRHQYDRATKSIEAASQLAPEIEDFHFLRAAIAFDQEHWQACLDHLGLALSLNPEHVGSLNLKARCLIHNEHNQQAQEIIQFALRVQPENATAHAIQGQLHLKKQDHTEAYASFQESLRLDPSDRIARNGWTAALKGQNPIYKRIIWLHSPHGQLFLGVGIVGCFIASLAIVPLMANGQMLWGAIFPYGLLFFLGLSILPFFASGILQLVMVVHRQQRLRLTSHGTSTTALIMVFVLIGIVLGMANLWLLGLFVGAIAITGLSLALFERRPRA